MKFLYLFLVSNIVYSFNYEEMKINDFVKCINYFTSDYRANEHKYNVDRSYFAGIIIEQCVQQVNSDYGKIGEHDD